MLSCPGASEALCLHDPLHVFQEEGDDDSRDDEDDDGIGRRLADGKFADSALEGDIGWQLR